MQHPFAALRGEYERLLATLRVTRPDAVDATARRLLTRMLRYQTVAKITGVPAVWLAAIHERESGADFATYLGNGDALNRQTVNVPRGRGPFMTWEAGALDALHLDGMDRIAAAAGGWTLPLACYEAETWNGMGPRNHGIHTGYLWAGTAHYTKGKYVADGRWDAGHIDRQLGVVPVMLRMIALDPSLALRGAPAATTPSSARQPRPQPAPDGVGADGERDALTATRRLQILLNSLGVPETPLAVDGSYGRLTREAVRAFQRTHRLEPDGLAGPLTRAALASAEAGLG
jgi:lysozyme family protein